MSEKKFDKFGSNRFGITNSKGEVVSEEYLRRYIHCWCRVEDGFVNNRKANLSYFMSDEFLSQHPGKTASQIGKIASQDPRWSNGKVEVKIDTYASMVEASLVDAQ